MKPAKDRPYKKDITYTDAQKNVKDYGIPMEHFKKPTSGMETIVSTPDPKRPYSNG
jgi:hypothetical protein